MKHWKIMGMALLALTAFMAVSASAAQAKWLLLRNGASVTSIEVTGSNEAGRLLVPGLGLTIACTGGTGSATATGGGTATLSGSATIVFAGCDVIEGFEEVCSVRGSTDAKGSNKVTAKGSGTASMTGSEVFLNAESTSGSPFANVIIEGEECPFIEIDGRTFGKVTFRVDNPLSDLATHTFSITSQSLTYGNQAAKVENNAGGNLSGSFTDSGGLKIAVHLRELSGCPTIC